MCACRTKTFRLLGRRGGQQQRLKIAPLLVPHLRCGPLLSGVFVCHVLAVVTLGGPAQAELSGLAASCSQVINKRRSEKPEVRQLGREAALREIKERMKKSRSEKAATKSAEQKKGGNKLAGKAPQPKAGGKAGKR